MILLFVWAAMGCLFAERPLQEHPRSSRNSPDIRGTVRELWRKPAGTPEGFPVLLLVEGAKEPDTTYSQASIRIVSNTRIYRERKDGTRERIPEGNLKRGDRIEAWFTGPVFESHPLRAMAEQIVVKP